MKSIEFKNNKKQTLRGRIFEPKKYNTAVIVLHGFPATCIGSTSRRARDISKHGYLAMCFDHSGTNTSDGKFEDKLISQENKEVKCAIDWLEKNYSFKRLILVGHSTGAINGALYAHKDKRVSKLVLSGGVAKLDESAHYDFSDRQVRDFWTKGYCTFKTRGYWANNKRLKKVYYDEFFKLNIPKALKKFRKPVLIIHGEKDKI
ncbi:MAG: alpha/beta hydrolase, partial [Candidatus Nanoarchaeia archaeon]